MADMRIDSSCCCRKNTWLVALWAFSTTTRNRYRASILLVRVGYCHPDGYLIGVICFRQYRDSVLTRTFHNLLERLLWRFDAYLQNRAGTDLRPDMYYNATVRLVRKGLQLIPVEDLFDIAGECKQLALAVGFADELQADW